jgi:ketosteroid isomerase-like protein
VTYKGLSADGRELRAMTNRLTWALRRQAGGDWKIVHEHCSAPADFDTGKVTLTR